MKTKVGENEILAQKDLDDEIWTVRFAFNPNQVLRNIFVDPVDFPHLFSPRQEASQQPLQQF